MTENIRQTISTSTPQPDINYRILVNNLTEWFGMVNVPNHTKDDEDKLASKVYPMIHASIANLMKKHGPDTMEAILCSVDEKLDRSLPTAQIFEFSVETHGSRNELHCLVGLAYKSRNVKNLLIYFV